jgi:hypothetical protein
MPQPTDLLPNPLAGDSLEALLWWLHNPILLHYYPDRCAELREQAATMLPNARLQTWLNMRKARDLKKARSAPLDYAGPLTDSHMQALIARIDDPNERLMVRRFYFPLTRCEWPWLAARLETALAARAADSSFSHAA